MLLVEAVAETMALVEVVVVSVLWLVQLVSGIVAMADARVVQMWS